MCDNAVMSLMDPQADEAPPAEKVVLSLDRLSFGYEPGEAIVSQVTAALRRGRITAMLGPNAAGKTTLLKLLLGQLRPWQGKAALQGQDVQTMSPMRRAARISYVPQRAETSFLFTVRQIIQMGRFAHPSQREAVKQALEMTELVDVEDRIFARLSGGQQQRVLLARAIAQAHGTGQVMLLDEPASAMDLWHVHEMMRLLRELAQAGLAILLVVHDLNLAARCADDVWLLDRGRLVAAGPWQDVLTPECLEPVYRVKLSPLTPPQGHRPMFFVHTGGTL